ncbi:hypothetical protein JZ751_022511 [Albula glossodonta]|uniref:Uncharacterized protein n=1 Tax=Albula glossodonta TaxID=121402 RepID=A0A8T2MYE8_9TELE|nr:hypothetical protein JZ751_022511 [Albula glossodonta]
MMAQDNSCLKRLCITFSVLYAILGVIFLFIGIAASSYKNEFEEIISTILHLVLSCQVREKNHTRPWRSCEDATLPPYKVLHEGAAL